MCVCVCVCPYLYHLCFHARPVSGGLVLMLDVSHRVLRQETVLDFLYVSTTAATAVLPPGSLVRTIFPHLPLSLQLHSVCQPPTWVPRGGHASDPRLCGAHTVQQPDLPRGRHCLGQEPAEHLCGLQWSACAVLGLLQVRGSTGEQERKFFVVTGTGPPPPAPPPPLCAENSTTWTFQTTSSRCWSIDQRRGKRVWSVQKGVGKTRTRSSV